MRQKAIIKWKTRNITLPAKLLAAAAAVMTAFACTAAQPVEIPFFRAGTVSDPAAALRCDAEWCLRSDMTESGLPAVWLTSTLTGETSAMAALEKTDEITDALYRNGIFYIAAVRPSDNGDSIGYTVYSISGVLREPVLEGVCGTFASQAPAFVDLEDGAVLVVQDQQEGLQIYQAPDHASESFAAISAEKAELISVTPKAHRNAFTLFAESETGARFLTYQVDFAAAEAVVVSDIPLEQGAGLIAYALTENRLVVCQQTAESMGAEPEYELLVYQLDTGEALTRQLLKEKPVYPLCGLENGAVLCQDDGGALFALGPDDDASRQSVDPIGTGPYTAFCKKNICYLMDGSGALYAVGVSSSAPAATPSAAPALTYNPNYESENQYVDEGGLKVLIAHNNALLPEYQASQIFASYEPTIDQFEFQLDYLQDGRRYHLESVFRWSEKALLFYEVHEELHGADNALPASVLQPLTEQRQLAIAQVLYDDLAAHTG